MGVLVNPGCRDPTLAVAAALTAPASDYGLQPGGAAASSRTMAPGGAMKVTIVSAGTDPSFLTMFSSLGPFSTNACPAV